MDMIIMCPACGRRHFIEFEDGQGVCGNSQEVVSEPGLESASEGVAQAVQDAADDDVEPVEDET